MAEATWYTDAVQWSTDNTITGIAGSCFGPETPVSRGETAVWIYNMENQPDAGERHSFTDVTDESQHDAVSWMANNEITTGTSPTAFAPDDTLRRAQVAAFLHRLAGEPSAPPHGFVDVVAAWQQEPVSWMAHTGITTGTSPNTFAPEDTVTRAQLVTFLYRYQGEPEVTLNTTTPDCAPTFKSVSAGGQHSCAIRSDDTAVCWGNNRSGQADAPTGGFKSVSAGGYHSCAVRSDDTAVYWGNNGSGQADAPAGGFKSVSAGSAGGGHSCAVRSDDTAVCWGHNGSGQADAPTGGFKSVSAGGYHSCAVRSDDTAVYWGNNGSGQADAPAGGFKSVSAGSAGGGHSCAVRSDDHAACHSCAVRSDDTAVCWGVPSLILPAR